MSVPSPVGSAPGVDVPAERTAFVNHEGKPASVLAVEAVPAEAAWLLSKIDSMSLFNSLPIFASWYASSSFRPAELTALLVPDTTTVFLEI